MRLIHYCRTSAGSVLCGALLALSGCAGLVTTEHRVPLTLSGTEEVPPVSTPASGSGAIIVAADKSVSGRVTTVGLEGVAAHIHQGARGTNGPVLIGLVKSVDNVWMVPAGARLTEPQYAAFMAGQLYVNVHSPANKGGEIRAQLVP
jgi:hypothetical protein